MLAVLTYISFTYYKKGKACPLSVGLQLGVALSLTSFAYTRFSITQGTHLAVLAFVR